MTYFTASTIARRSVARDRPIRFAAGMSGAINAHSASFGSLVVWGRRIFSRRCRAVSFHSSRDRIMAQGFYGASGTGCADQKLTLSPALAACWVKSKKPMLESALLKS